ncbi:hypothetical protein F383_28237 [Gossypium arboreum]|uniref:Uncharacterized protein n=1 Tax=Gossypium arboreum TaxID=29729 RepID=A0A0B0P851_GOSAR|nr:hypothetical protein F383_28237 [Gossypium arboreum]
MAYIIYDCVISPNSDEIVLLRQRCFPTELLSKTLKVILRYLKMCL